MPARRALSPQRGAQALATVSASVAAANGSGDGEAVPLDLVLANAERIAAIRNGTGRAFFIDARTDIFLQTKPNKHDDR